MKKFNEIYAMILAKMAIIKEMQETSKEIDSKIDALKDGVTTIAGRKALKNDESFNAYLMELAKNEDKIHDAETELKILKHNAEIAFIHEYLPLVLDILNQYKGKRIGEKTEEKIRNTIKEKYNIGVSFNHSKDITLYAYNYYALNRTNIEICAKYNNEAKDYYRNFNAENKLNELSVDMFHVKDNYIEDIEAYIKDKKAKIKAINEAIAVLKNSIDEYNDNLISGIERPSIYDIKTYGYKV